jgi:hypothetical protein
MKKTLRPSGGAILDIDSLELGDQFLSLAQNVNTRKGFPSRIGGRRVAYPVVAGGAPNDPYHLLQFELNTFNWWLHFSTNTIYAVEGPNSYNVTPVGMASITAPSEWTSALLNGIPVFSNGRDLPMYWDGDGAHLAQTLPGWPVATTCKAISTFKFHIFAFNIDSPSGIFDNVVMWSDAADPGTLPTTWTPAASNEAGSLFLADTPGRVICGIPLTAQLLTYKPQSIYAIEYAGQPPANIFTARPVSRSVGALGPHCVVEVDLNGPRHAVLGNDDVVITDGVGVRSIADNRVRRAIANSIDETNALNAFVVRDIHRRELWVCVPEAGNTFANIAHIWDEARDSWVTRDLNQVRYGVAGYVTDTTTSETWDSDPNTWDSDSSIWNSGTIGKVPHVVTAEASKIYVEDTNDVVTLTSRIARYDMNFDDDTQIKITQRVTIEGSGTALNAVQFRLGARKSTKDNIAWGNFVACPSGGKAYEVNGRYISIEIQSTGGDFTVDRIVIEAVYDGSN